MNTINENSIVETVINKSRFICCLFKITNINEINKYIDDMKLEYKGATHYCYAYIFSNKKKCSDDKEPNGTAGLPILNVLEKNNLTNILCIVIRYFGGIKLGAGGLVRAYTNSVINSLNKTTIRLLKNVKVIEITFDYNNLKQIDLLLKEKNFLNKAYNEEIKYTVYINEEEFDNVYKKLESLCTNISILKSLQI